MQVFTKSFSLELFLGIHNFSADVIRVALYGPSAVLDADTAAYSPTNEVAGLGYAAGGRVMPRTAGYPKLEDGRGAVRFDRVTWPAPSTFSYQKVLIYNASRANRSIFVIDFGVPRGPDNGSHFFELPPAFPPFLVMNRGA